MSFKIIIDINKMDLKSISKTYFHKMRSAFGIKTKYGKRFSEDPFGYGYDAQYEFMFFNKPLALIDFKKFLESKNDVKSVLEVGCSVGLFPRTFPHLFKNIEYTGIDISEHSIDICKKSAHGEFICGDFLNLDLSKKYDLVFSFHVIDHVADVDLFLKKIIEYSKKYSYISSYRGYFPDLEQHKIQYRNDQGIYYNDISIKQIERILLQNNLKKNDFIIYQTKERDKILYDSELARVWKYSNDERKREIIEYSGLSNSLLDELSINLELSTKILDSCQGLDKIIAKKIGFDTDYKQFHDTTTIEINKD